MRVELGERVGAVAFTTEKEIHLYGYGVYQGEITPDEEEKVRIFGIPMDHPNPCILLDSGLRVYGCECWWGPETKIQQMSKGLQVVNVDIVAARKAVSEVEE
jgi:hypothetical protein